MSFDLFCPFDFSAIFANDSERNALLIWVSAGPSQLNWVSSAEDLVLTRIAGRHRG
jgi:hypothetical protein